jgi:hypothetical protein
MAIHEYYLWIRNAANAPFKVKSFLHCANSFTRFAMPESPRYFYKKRDIDSMNAVITEICLINQVQFPADEIAKLEDPYHTETESQQDSLLPKENNKNIIVKLIELKLLKTSVFLVLIWMFISLGYNSFNSFIPIFMKAKGRH